MVTCWTHKQKIEHIDELGPYCPGCIEFIINKQNEILDMKKDDLLDLSVKLGLLDEVKYSMNVEDIQIVILNKLKLLI